MKSDDTCLISVLVPVYNAEKYLPECIESILAQTFNNFEAIFLNDGSKDHSLEILEKYAAKDKRIKIIDSTNKGVAAARNALLAAAEGEFISFVDSDDYIVPKYLETLIKKQQETDADIIRCSWNELKDKKILPPSYSSKRDKAIGNEISSRIYAGFYDSSICGKLIKTSLIKDIGISLLQGYVAEDLSFAIMAFVCAGHIETINDRLYIYRKGNENSITALSNRDRMIIGRLENIVYACDFLEKRGKLKGSAESAAMTKYILWNMSSLLKIKSDSGDTIEKSYGKALETLQRIVPNMTALKRALLNSFFCLEKKLKGKKRFALCKIFRSIV